MGWKKLFKPLLAGLTAIPLAISNSAFAHADEQIGLDAREKPLISVDGLKFKDLNANGQLDTYEDWRRPVEERVADLISQMTVEEKAGLMLIDTLNAACGGEVPELADDYINNQFMHRFVFRNTVAGDPNCEAGGRQGVQVSPREAAEFTNSIQEMSEATRLGIPSLFKSNARNHIDPNARFGINVSSGSMSAFPKEAGIASAALGQDSMAPVEAFTDVMAAEWASIGLRGMYGYMADLATEPRWYRVHETFTEDAELNADIMKTLVEQLQGPLVNGSSLSPDSAVALTMKHFPGGGPQELGLDPHYSFGKTQVYTDGGFEYNLKPFEAAINAGVSSIMPYYGVPMDVTHNGTTYQHTGFAFSDQIVNGLLRDELGFKGYVNSDTGIINDRAWGLEEATVPERVAAAINGGTDTLSGFHDVAVITDLINSGLVSMERVDLAADRLLTPLFELGLFENPYVDPAGAEDEIGAADHREAALDVQRKSLVLLENKNSLLPLKKDSTVLLVGDFDQELVKTYGYRVIDGNAEDLDIAAAAAAADVALINLSATNGGAADYDSTNHANHPVNPIEMTKAPGSSEFIPGLDGESRWGESDACIHSGTDCTDNGLRFGGSLPWESSILDFSGMAKSKSWEVTPGLERVLEIMQAVGPENTILNVYFRQPYVLDEASGLRDAGAIVARFGVSDTALFDVLSGKEDFSGKLPYALPASRKAVEEQASDKPGYDDTADGALYKFGYGLSYKDSKPSKPNNPEKPSKPARPGKPGLPSTGV